MSKIETLGCRFKSIRCRWLCLIALVPSIFWYKIPVSHFFALDHLRSLNKTVYTLKNANLLRFTFHFGLGGSIMDNKNGGAFIFTLHHFNFNPEKIGSQKKRFFKKAQ